MATSDIGICEMAYSSMNRCLLEGLQMRGEVIVFAPHPDDETLGCGGTIARKVSEGYNVLIVVMTNGGFAFLKSLGANSGPTPDELKRIRKEETIRAARILGVPEENLFFLDFEDGILEKYEKEAEEKVIEILNEYSPVEVYFPYKKDCHRDHRVTNRIVRNSIKKLGLSTMKFQYSIVQRYAHISPPIDTLLNLLMHSHKRIRVDISEFLDLKKAAIEEFRSQTSIVSTKQKRPVIKNVEKFIKDKETFYIDK